MELAEQALAEPPPEARAAIAAVPRAAAADGGPNLVGNAERLDGAIATAYAKVEMSWDFLPRIWPRSGPFADWFRREYRILPVGSVAEHYAAISLARIPAGGMELTFEAKAETVNRLRVQLMDGESNGVLADVDLANRSVGMTRLGSATGLQATLEQASGKWQKIVLSATVPGGGGGQVIFQLLDESGKTVFSPKGQSMTFRNVRLGTF
jgi:hypothetical protein